LAIFNPPISTTEAVTACRHFFWMKLLDERAEEVEKATEKVESSNPDFYEEKFKMWTKGSIEQAR